MHDRVDFAAATPSVALVDFEDFGVSSAFSDASAVAFPAGPFGPASIARQGVTLSSYGVTGGGLSAAGPVVTDTRSAVNVLGPNYLGYSNAGSAYFVSEIARSSLLFDFGSAQTAVGLDIGTLLLPLQPGQDPSHFFGSNRTFDLVFDFGSERSFTATFDHWQFIGFQFDNPVTTFSIAFADGPESALYPDSTNYIGIDNLAFDNPSVSASPVPCPPSLQLALVGIVGIVSRCWAFPYLTTWRFLRSTAKASVI